MLLTLTTLATLGTAGLVQLPKLLPLPTDLEGTTIEVILQATSNHLAAENTSTMVQVLVFELAGADTLPVFLAPGARTLYAFPRGTGHELSIEVIALDQTNGWRNSGAFELSQVRSTGALWVQAGPASSTLWIEAGREGLAHLAPSRDLVPEPWRAVHPELTEFSPTQPHVPVPMPSEGKKGGKPPVIEKKKLPPV
jgi:hypothetical protein